LPDHPSALEGAESTQGKCSSSAAAHAGRRRNANECCGAYGHELTWEEMQWLARWCFVRGVNLLYPHAFYYSLRGPRRDERPPDVGPNAPWWPRYGEYADACRRLAWLNTDSRHVCELAILGESDRLPWRAARACFRAQRDFNYLEERDLSDRAGIDEEGIRVAGMTYRALIAEHEPGAAARRALEPLACAGRIVRYTPDMSDAALMNAIGRLVPRDVMCVVPAPALRARHVTKSGLDWYLLFNEEQAALETGIDFAAEGERFVFDPVSARLVEFPRGRPLRVAGHGLQVVVVANVAGSTGRAVLPGRPVRCRRTVRGRRRS
jgi:hypothetical protein